MKFEYNDYGYTSVDFSTHHPYLFPVIRRLVGTPSGPVLDLGCGNGWTSLALLREGVDVFGVDASESGIRIASERAPGRFHLMNFSAGVLPRALDEVPFRTIICTEVIGHLYNPRALLDLSWRILAKHGGGKLIISTPYHGYLKNFALAVFNKWDAHHGVLWNGGIIKFFSRKTLEKMLSEHGFLVNRFSGAGRVPFFYKSMVISAEASVTSELTYPSVSK